MRAPIAILLALFAVGIAGCAAQDQREWMKVDRRYTTQEFQRDHRDCSRKGDLDDACMRERGWVPVNPSRTEAPPPMDPLQRSRGRY
jgi:hypothetical protein